LSLSFPKISLLCTNPGCADDLVILIDSHPRHGWLVRAVERRLREEVAKLRVEINEDKSRMVDLAKSGSFSFLGFEYRRILRAEAKTTTHRESDINH